METIMDETVFEHSVFSQINEYLEHCRKQLQSAVNGLFQELDHKLNGLIVLFALDMAKSSNQVLIMAPEKDWIRDIFSPQIDGLSHLVRSINHNVRNKKHGTMFSMGPTVIQSFVKKVLEDSFGKDINIFYTEPILAGSFVVFASFWCKTDDYTRHYMLSPKGTAVRSLVDSSIKHSTFAAKLT